MVTMQSLFEWDFNNGKETAEDILSRNINNLVEKFDDGGFAMGLVRGVLENRAELDRMISQYATEWPIDQITVTDRNILRLGAYELAHCPDIPAKVVINEAIELAKEFGGGSSGKFVNGVMGAIYKELLDKGVRKEEIKASASADASAGGQEH